MGEDKPSLRQQDIDPQGHDIVNLLSLDTQRISDFCSYNNIFPSVLVTFVIAVVILVKLIGWISLFAGLGASVLLMPLNTWASKHYNVAQTNLMMARDAKVSVVSEALQGIRQIKYFASEASWHEKIMELRRPELGHQSKVFLWALALRFCWVASPILLSLAALATYSLRYGSLSASVAFTSLALFGNLEWCLSVVPLFIAQLMDARVSSSRILNLLHSTDRDRKTQSGHSIEFRDALLEWYGSARFRLKATLTFPSGALR